MAFWEKRTNLYKAGFVCIVLGTFSFIVGFGTPTWAFYQSRQVEQYMGLWQTCLSDLSVCRMNVGSDNPGWLKAVRALECISMFFAVAACVVGTYCNCMIKGRQSPELFNKNMETAAVVSVLFGTFSLIIFATQASHFYHEINGKLAWGFILTCVGDTLLGMGAFLMLVSRKLQMMILRDYFAHQQFQDSSHTDVPFPDGARALPDVAGEAGFMGPPDYDTVVNSTPRDDVAPPAYSEVVKEENQNAS